MTKHTEIENFINKEFIDIKLFKYDNTFDVFFKIIKLEDLEKRNRLNLLLKEYIKGVFGKSYNFSEKNLA